MKAIILKQFGGVENLALANLPVPALRSHAHLQIESGRTIGKISLTVER